MCKSAAAAADIELLAERPNESNPPIDGLRAKGVCVSQDMNSIARMNTFPRLKKVATVPEQMGLKSTGRNGTLIGTIE